MIGVLGAAFLTGLLGSFHCVGMCGGFAAACATRHGARGTTFYSLGRLSTYAVLGATAGALGGVLQDILWVGFALSALLLLYFAGRLAGLWAGPSVAIPGLGRLMGRAARRGGGLGQYALGAANALLPCGLVYAALALPVVAGSAGAGALSMLAFGLGTVPALATIGFTAKRIAGASRGLRVALALGVLVAGSFALLQRLPAEPAARPSCCSHADQP